MSAPRARTVAALAAPCALALVLAAPDLDRPGLYYDEVIQAQPALQFLAADGRPSEIPGITSTRLLGGWFPVMTQPYMGALKSQLLIPSFALFGSSATSLRATTLGWGLLGLLLAVLWARQVLGLPAALLGGALLAVDPSFLFIARHDWGSFSLGLVTRCAALLLLTTGWRRGSALALAAGGLCLGLGLYNKIDFAVFVAAAGIAWIVAAPRTAALALGARRVHALSVLAGAAVGAGPLFASLPQALATTRAVAGRQTLESPDWGEKLYALTSTLDGSYFHALMLAGGSFEDVASVEGAASGPFPWLFAAALVWIGVRFARRRRDLDPAVVFVWAAALLTLLGTFLTPRAVRIHHALNVFPLPHLVVAAAITDVWRTRREPVAHVIAAAAVAASLVGSVAVDVRTRAALRESGGKGRWSDAVARFAEELETGPAGVVVTLDWGFEQPLRFLAPALPVLETIWTLRRSRPLALDGTPETVYLTYPEAYDVFEYGGQFLEAVETLPEEVVSVRSHADGEGDTAFLSIRIARPHRLVYRDGFEVELR